MVAARKWSTDGSHHKYPSLHLKTAAKYDIFDLERLSKVILAIQNLCPQANSVYNMNILRLKRKRVGI